MAVGFSALIRAMRPSGTWTSASYENRMPGLSCTGIHVRARIAWLWVKRKGALSPWASTHNNASAPGSEVYCMATFFAPVEIGMLKGRPRKGWASPRENSPGWPSTLTPSMVSSWVSNTMRCASAAVSMSYVAVPEMVRASKSMRALQSRWTMRASSGRAKLCWSVTCFMAAMRWALALGVVESLGAA